MRRYIFFWFIAAAVLQCVRPVSYLSCTSNCDKDSDRNQADTGFHMNRFPHFIYSRRSVPAGEPVPLDLTRFSRIIDFTCNHKHSGGFFNRIVDCLIPNAGLVKMLLEWNENECAVIVPTELLGWIEAFLPSQKRVMPLFVWQKYILISRKTTVIFERALQHQTRTAALSHSSGTPSKTLVDSKAVVVARMAREGTSFRQIVAWSMNVTSATAVTSSAVAPQISSKVMTTSGSNETIRGDIHGISPTANNLFIHLIREESRILSPEVHLMLRQQFPGYTHVDYTGTGISPADTVRLFSQAAVVLGFQGAGFANTIFCPDRTLVVEIAFICEGSSPKAESAGISSKATYYPLSSNKPWLTSHHNSLNWITYGLDLEAAGISRHIREKSSNRAYMYRILKVYKPVIQMPVEVVDKLAGKIFSALLPPAQ